MYTPFYGALRWVQNALQSIIRGNNGASQWNREEQTEQVLGESLVWAAVTEISQDPRGRARPSTLWRRIGGVLGAVGIAMVAARQSGGRLQDQTQGQSCRGRYVLSYVGNTCASRAAWLGAWTLSAVGRVTATQDGPGRDVGRSRTTPVAGRGVS